MNHSSLHSKKRISIIFLVWGIKNHLRTEVATTNANNEIYIKVLKVVQEFCFQVSGNIHSCYFKGLLLTSDARNWILILHTSSCQTSFRLKFIKYNFRWWMDVSKLGVVPEPNLLQLERKVLGDYKIQKYKWNEVGASSCLFVGANAWPAAQISSDKHTQHLHRQNYISGHILLPFLAEQDVAVLLGNIHTYAHTYVCIRWGFFQQLGSDLQSAQ